MRIFVATGIFHPEPGGPATYLYHLLPELVARGHEVRLLTYGAGPAEGYPYPVTRIPRVFLPVRLARYARAAFALASWSEVMFINSLVLPLWGMPRRPAVMKVVGDMAWERAINRGWISPQEDILTFQRRYYGPRVSLLKAWRARQVRWPARVIVPGAYLRGIVTGWGADPARVRVVYNALKPLPPLPDAADARAELGLPPGPLLLYTGRLAAYKGVDFLLRSMVALPEAHLVVAGDGPERVALEELASTLGVAGRVRFLGQVAQEQIARLYRAADYTVLYSSNEGLSHVLLESLQAGTPVIASDVGGNPEVVREGINGLLVPWPDQSALTETLRRALTEAGWRERLASGTGAGLERFSWSRLVERTLGVLAEALEEGQTCTS